MLRPSFLVRPSFPCVVAVGMVCVGCAPAPAPVKPAASQGQKATHDDHHHGHGHEDHAHPETLAAGLAELEGIATAVKTHLDAGARDKADKAVHMVGHLVEDLRGLLPKENLSAEAQAAAGKALEVQPSLGDPEARVRALAMERQVAEEWGRLLGRRK